MPTDTLLVLGAAFAGLIAFAVVMARWEKAAKAAMATLDHFQVKGFEANIDRARNEVHISMEGYGRIFCAPLGHLVVEHKVETVTLAYEKRPRRRCRVALTSNRRRLLATGRPVASRDWAETVWTAVETGKTWVRLRAVRLPAYYAQHWGAQDEGCTQVQTDIRDVSLPNGSAKAFKLWVDHHGRQLFPDVAAVRAKWDQECAELLRACRQQRDHYANAAGALETWSFSSEPTIAYFVIEANGAAFWAAGNTPMLEPIDRPRSKLAEDKLIISSDDEHRSFPIPTSRIATLQALQRLGVAQMA